MVPSTVHCQVLQNDYPERCSNTCTLQYGLSSKMWGFSCLFNNKIPCCKSCLKKRLSKVITHFKITGIDKDAFRVCGDWWTDLSNKNCWFPKPKDHATVKDSRERNRNEASINKPNAPDGSLVKEEDLLTHCRISFKFSNRGVKYAQYHFQNKL